MIFRILLALGILVGIIAFFTPAFVILEDGVATPVSAVDIHVKEQTFRVGSLLAGKVSKEPHGVVWESDKQCQEKYEAHMLAFRSTHRRGSIEEKTEENIERAKYGCYNSASSWGMDWRILRFIFLVVLLSALVQGETRVGWDVVLAGLITVSWLAQQDLDATKTLDRLQATLATLGILAGLGLRAPLGLRAAAEESEDTRDERTTASIRMWDSRLSAGGWFLGALIFLPVLLALFLELVLLLVEGLLAPDWSLVLKVPAFVTGTFGLACLTIMAISQIYWYLRKSQAWWGTDPFAPFAPSSQRADGADPIRRSWQQGWMSKCGEDEHGRWAEAEVAGVTFRFRYCPAGTFQMGSPSSEVAHWVGETPHEVLLTKGFWLGATPVTQRLWEAVTGENPSQFIGPDRPVERVSWDDCVAFLGKVNARCPGLDLRLPTEAEWEYACRAGTTGPTYLGANDAATLDRLGWYGPNSGGTWDPESLSGYEGGHTHPVGQKAPNAWGLYDTLGSVSEWCADWYANYPSGRQVNPKGPRRGAFRVVRGGDWVLGASTLRAAYRGFSLQGHGGELFGFRMARSGP
jgi:sulfatase modifying factor 1